MKPILKLVTSGIFLFFYVQTCGQNLVGDHFYIYKDLGDSQGGQSYHLGNAFKTSSGQLKGSFIFEIIQKKYNGGYYARYLLHGNNNYIELIMLEESQLQSSQLASISIDDGQTGIIPVYFNTKSKSIFKVIVKSGPDLITSAPTSDAKFQYFSNPPEVSLIAVLDSEPTFKSYSVDGSITLKHDANTNDESLSAINFYNDLAASETTVARIQARRGLSSHDRGDLAFYTKDGTALSEAFRVTSYGNIGIGISNPSDKLVVDGNIRGEEVKVEVIDPPDYVFEENYNLKSLEEVRNFILKHGHLPEVPSADEMTSNGVALGEMNMLLLKKIEELTLHNIRQEEVIESNLQMIKEMQREIFELKKKYDEK